MTRVNASRSLFSFFSLGRATVFAAAIALVAPVAQASLPDGPYTFDVGSSAPLVVVDGDVDLSSFLSSAFFCKKVNTKPDGSFKGKCKVDVPNQRDDLKGGIKGKLEQKDDRTVLKEKLKLGTTIKINGRKFKYKYEWDFSAVWIRGSDIITYVYRVKSCLNNQCSKSDKVEFDVPSTSFRDIAFVTYGWVLAMNVKVKDGEKIKGKATVTLEDGTVLDYKVSGKCNDDDTSTIKFKPDGKGAKGSAMKLVDAVYDADTETLTGDLIFDLFGNSSTVRVVSATAD